MLLRRPCWYCYRRMAGRFCLQLRKCQLDMAGIFFFACDFQLCNLMHVKYGSRAYTNVNCKAYIFFGSTLYKHGVTYMRREKQSLIIVAKCNHQSILMIASNVIFKVIMMPVQRHHNGFTAKSRNIRLITVSVLQKIYLLVLVATYSVALTLVAF